MKKSIKLSVFLILVLAIAISVFGCAKKTPGKTINPSKQTEQKKPDEEQKKPSEEEKKLDQEEKKPSEEESKPGEEESKPSIKNKVKTKFTIKGQKTFGEEYEQAEGTEGEYVSSIEKEEGQTVKASELLDLVKEKINETIYNKDEMLYKYAGEAITETQPIQVKSPNTVIEFYVKRQIRTITLDTTDDVNTSNVRGAVEIANGNKTLNFRHGYSFVGDETPTIAETENEEFNGWLKDSNIYRFDNTTSVTANITLRPNMKNKIEIKFAIKGQKTFGDGYEKAEDTVAEYGSNIKKKEGQTVQPSELLNFVKKKINETIYNKNEMSYKHDGEAVDKMQAIQVKSPNTVIEFYVKRQIRTITLDTTHDVNTSNVKGAVEIAEGNKTLKFRHGYNFEGDETPVIAGTEEDEFNGWLNGQDIYRFGNPNSVTSDATLTPNMKKREAIVNINLNGLRAEGLQYADSGILGMPDSTGNKITLRVPCERFKNYSVYRLTNLKTENGAVFYNETTQKQVRHTGYIGDRWIYEEGKTYEVTAAYTEESETIYKGMYPQTKKSISGTTVDTKKTYSLMYGTFEVITSYSKGKKYEKIGSDYYLYEPVERERFPACKDWQEWTVNTIDISIFHEYKDDSNIYANSYIKQYLEQVVKAKLQATSVALPKLKNTTTDVMPDDEAGKYCGLDIQQQELKYKKITDYATAVRSNYQSLRGISVVFYPGEYYSQYTWLGTRDDISLRRSYSIAPWGRLSMDDTYCVFGLRPAISI